MTNQLRSPLRSAIRSPLEHRRGGASWSPLALFASGEKGVIYDPSDMSTLYQDSAGTTPVTAAGQPVGLMLDKSQGLVLGAELVTNGTFDSNVNGWIANNANATFTWSGGKASFTSASFAYTALQTLITLGPVERTYQISYEISNWVPGLSIVHVGLGLSGSPPVIGNGTYRFYQKAVGNMDFQIRPNGGGTGGFDIDNISVKLLSGNHATQLTAGKRPLENGVPIKIDYDAVDDNTVTTFASSLGSSCTVARSVPSTGASILTAQTIGATYTDSTDHHALVIIDRALTGTETANLTAWLNKKAGL